MPHVVATISGHGYGHLSISAPVLNRLRLELADLKLTIISGLPEQRIQTRVAPPFNYQNSALDFGVVMGPDLSVQVKHTADAYRRVHANWDRQVDAYAEKLKRLGCDLVLSNISYLSLAAAGRLEIPAVAVCPLNWADMYQYYCHREQDCGRIHRQMISAYASARVFLQPEPCMPMNELSNTRRIGPIAATGRDIGDVIRGRLRLAPGTKLILVATGGHDMRLPALWPGDEAICWLVTRSWQVDQDNVVVLEELDTPFLDLLASCDLLVTKPGYGSFAEAACAGKPVLYLPRPDWPETEFLVRWIQRYHAARELSPDSLRDGVFAADLGALLDSAAAVPAVPSGVAETVDAVLAELSLQS